MSVEDQTATLAFLGDPGTYGPGVVAVERIDTHCSHVFLAGDHAYKLKRAVHYPFLDYGTLARRKLCAEREMTLNRRTAPTLYDGVVAVTRAPDGTLALGGAGEAIDYVVVMPRFDQAMQFDRMAARGALDERLLTVLADEVHAFHEAAERRPDKGGAKAMRWVVEDNLDELAASGLFDAAAQAALDASNRAALERYAALLDRRRDAGFVRLCHGDLHLRNIALFEGRPTLFDAVEFGDEIACVDVWYDTAFLLMDLHHRGFDAGANLVMNRLIGRSGDVEGLALLPLFLATRACVRSKIAAIEAQDAPTPEARDNRVATARHYHNEAQGYLVRLPARLVAIGGLSGSGKSTLAAALAQVLAPTPGAVWLRSDVIRKRLAGVAPEDRLGKDGYSAAMNARVYDTLRDEVATVLAGGHTVVVDAVHARPEERAAIEAIAAAAGVPFDGLWLAAPRPTLAARTAVRRADASDAGPGVVDLQLGLELGQIAWTRLDATGDRAASLAAAQAVLAPTAPAA